VSESGRHRLEFRLRDAAGALITRNHQDLYFFPRSVALPGPALVWADEAELRRELAALGYPVTDHLPEADVAVVETMTDSMRQYVEHGGRVLFLAETPEARQTPLQHIGVSKRQGTSWQGDWASNFNWLRRDRMFRHIPTDGVCDFAFADLTPECVITGFSPRDFACDVHAGLFVGWLRHHAALVAERRFGSGRLMLSTLRLRHHLRTHPVATIMLRDMVDHLARPLR
jgi:hypothetical protein